MMWGYGFGWGGTFGMVLTWALCIALLVVLVWALIRWVGDKTTTAPSKMTTNPPSDPLALEILHQRYARGEIDTATFEHKREQLGASGEQRYQPGNPPLTNVR